MARPNRRGHYYNYPNLRTDMNKAPFSEIEKEAKATAQELDTSNRYENAQREEDEQDTYDDRDDTDDRDYQEEDEDNNQEEDTCKVRFFNAAAGYGGLKIEVAGETISENLPFGQETAYVYIPDGFQQVTITMVQEPEAVLLNKRMPFRNCMNTTAAIINTSTGIDLMMINDEGCRMDEADRACFRVANLSYTSPPLDVIIENGNPVFEDVRFKYVTEYKQAVPGEYNFNVMLARTAETLQNNTSDLITPELPQEEGGYPAEEERAYAYFFEEFEAGRRYTAYIIGNKDYEPALRVETLIEGE